MGLWSAHLRDRRAETDEPRVSFLGRLVGLVAEHQKLRATNASAILTRPPRGS